MEQGQTVFIESTAEGREGDFYALYRSTKAKADSGVALSPLDFKLHFFPWWRDPDYRLETAAEAETVPAPLQAYFAGLQSDHGIRLDDAQRAWYAKKAEVQGADMAGRPQSPTCVLCRSRSTEHRLNCFAIDLGASGRVRAARRTSRWNN